MKFNVQPIVLEADIKVVFVFSCYFCSDFFVVTVFPRQNLLDESSNFIIFDDENLASQKNK